MMQPGAMKAHSREGKQSFLEENRLDDGQDCEGEGPEDFSVPECRVVVPPPSHVMCERALQLEKQRENTLVWNPECRRLVDSMLLDVYMDLQPTKEQRDARRSVIDFVDTVVKQRMHGMCSFSTKGYSNFVSNFMKPHHSIWIICDGPVHRVK